MFWRRRIFSCHVQRLQRYIVTSLGHLWAPNWSVPPSSSSGPGPGHWLTTNFATLKCSSGGGPEHRDNYWGYLRIPQDKAVLIGKLFRMFLSGTCWYTIKFQGNLFCKIKRDTHTYAIASAQIVKLGISLSLSLYIYICAEHHQLPLVTFFKHMHTYVVFGPVKSEDLDMPWPWQCLPARVESASPAGCQLFWYLIFQLVGGWPTPVKNMKVSWDDEIPSIWKNKKCSKPPTRYNSMFRRFNKL